LRVELEWSFIDFGGKMSLNVSRQRLYASLLILGACVLLFRTMNFSLTHLTIDRKGVGS